MPSQRCSGFFLAMPIKIFLKSTASTSPVLSAASIVAPPALASAPSFNVVHACSQSREGLRSRDPVGSHCLMIVLVEEVEEGFFWIKKTRPAQPQLEGATRRESERERRARERDQATLAARYHVCCYIFFFAKKYTACVPVCSMQ